jgi:hypothetical protein
VVEHKHSPSHALFRVLLAFASCRTATPGHHLLQMELPTPETQHLDYFSASSASNTLAPPSPETEIAQLATMTDSQATQRHKRGSSSAAPLSQYAALGQLSYAPATQTTVVTTTTTTTTSFPPLILRAPRHLYDRDPKQYPLAASPTPASIRDFTFDVNGKPACFREADDVEDSLQQVCFSTQPLSTTKRVTDHMAHVVCPARFTQSPGRNLLLERSYAHSPTH